LTDLRMDFSMCGFIVAHKLIGSPELRRAVNVEHFNQSDCASPVTFHEMGVQGPC
jgi:hypothetical protein